MRTSQKFYARLVVGVFFSISLGISAHAGATLFGATSSIDITPRTGVPLAGYGGGKRRIIPWDIFGRYPYATFLTPSKGKLDPIRAKVLLLQKEDQRLLFIGLDFVAFTAENRADLMKILNKMGFLDHEVYISATHTHSGPGTLSKNFFWELIASDLYQKKIYRKVLSQIVDAVVLAISRLRPVDLQAGAFDAEGLQTNRRIANGPFDNRANLLWIRDQASGNWLGGLTNLAMHGTSLGTDNHLYSADANGAVERALEAQLLELNSATPYDPTMIYINGAEGDVTPSLKGTEGMSEIGSKFAGQALVALIESRTLSPTWTSKVQRVNLGTPYLNIRGCLEQKTLRSLISRKLRFTLRFLFPAHTHIYSLRLGDMALLSWPGEPTTALGLALRQQSERNEIRQAWVMGLTNDYLAYWTSPEEYQEPTYEACSSLYGEKGGTIILEAHKKLLFSN